MPPKFKSHTHGFIEELWVFAIILVILVVSFAVSLARSSAQKETAPTIIVSSPNARASDVRPEEGDKFWSGFEWGVGIVIGTIVYFKFKRSAVS